MAIYYVCTWGNRNPREEPFTRTREEAEEYRAHRWRLRGSGVETRQDEDRIEPIEIQSTIVYNGPGGVGGLSIWSNGAISRQAWLAENHWPIDRKTGERYGWIDRRPVPINVGGLTEEALALIKGSLGSDSGSPDWLGRVRDVRRAIVSPGRAKSGGYAGPEVERLTITLDDGSILRKWLATEGYCEGYSFDFHDSSREALGSFERRDWLAIECLECGATYDRPGHVEPGAMGCDRCNSEQTDWHRHLVGAVKS